jgi:MarR family transcriptional regulator, organic hydroperoxide resistance regulator
MVAKAPNSDDLWPTLIELVMATRGWWIALCAEFDLTPAQGHALRALDPEQPVAMSTLAEAMLCDASNVTGIVDKLETRGLLSRQGTDHDRRVKQLVVTEPGRRLRDKLIARMLESPEAVSALPEDVKAHLVTVIRAVLAERIR